MTNNYSLSVAQQMPGNWILQASYVGNNSNSLMDNGTTQTVVLDNINAIPVGTLFTPTAAAAINAKAPGACNATGCTPAQAGSLDNIYNYPGDKAIQKARPFPNYSQILVPRHNTYANYNGFQIEAIKQAGTLQLQRQLLLLQGARHSRFLGGLQLDCGHRSLPPAATTTVR